MPALAKAFQGNTKNGVGVVNSSRGGGAKGKARLTVSLRTPAGESPALSVPPSGAKGRSVDIADGWARNGRDGRVFHVARQGFSRRFPPFRNYFRFLQIHFRYHANICTHFISLLDGHFKTFWTARALFQVLPVPEFYFRSNTQDRK